jgi:thiamine biosynthesis protein ThiI
MIAIVRYAEIALKGRNRNNFEKQLMKNIGLFIPGAKIKRVMGRFLIYDINESKKLSHIFGISSYSFAEETDNDLNSILSKAKEHSLSLDLNKPTRIIVKRVNKKLPFTSVELEKLIADNVLGDDFNIDLKNYEQSISIELINNKAYFFKEVINGLRGLPIGSQGLAIGLIRHKYDALASILAMKRGVKIKLVFRDEKARHLIDLLRKFDPGIDETEEFDDLPIFVGEQSLKRVTNGFELNPLLGFSNEELKQMLDFYEGL